MSVQSHRIAVTGASGFVGTWVMKKLQALNGSQPIEVYPLLGSFGDLAGDITDQMAVAKAVTDLQPTGVIHLAAVAFPAEAGEDPHRAWQVNVLGTLNLARAILQHAPATRLVFAGSSEAYGSTFNAHPGPVPEDVPLKPTSVYGATKAAADLLLGQLAHDGLRAIRFRPFNHTGPGQSHKYVVSAFARQIARIEAGLQAPVIHVGNLEAERDFLDVRDVVDAYVAAALGTNALLDENVYNLASGRPWAIRAVLENLLATSARSIDVRVEPVRFRKSDIPRASGDPSRAGIALGWQPTIQPEQTFRDVLDYWRGVEVNSMEAPGNRRT